MHSQKTRASHGRGFFRFGKWLALVALVLTTGCASEPTLWIERGMPKPKDGSSSPIHLEHATRIANAAVAEREHWPNGKTDRNGVLHWIDFRFERIDDGGWKVVACRVAGKIFLGGEAKLEGSTAAILIIDKHGAVTSYTHKKLMRTPHGLQVSRE